MVKHRLTARRGHLQYVLEIANEFKATKVAEKNSIQPAIDAIAAAIDNSTSDKDIASFEEEKKQLEAQLEQAKLQSEYSTADAFRQVFPSLMKNGKLTLCVQGYTNIEEALYDAQEAINSLKKEEA